MSNCFHVILTAASMVIGFAVLIASAMAIHKYKDGISQCLNKDDKSWIFQVESYRSDSCAPFYAITGVVTVGLLTAAIQIIYNLVSLVRRDYGGRGWAGVHIWIFILSLVAFAIGLHYFGDKDHPITTFYESFRHQDINRYLIAINGIDFMFSFIASIFACCCPRSAEHRYGRPSGD